MTKINSLRFNASAKLSASQSLSVKGGDDKRGERPGGGPTGFVVAPPPVVNSLVSPTLGTPAGVGASTGVSANVGTGTGS